MIFDPKFSRAASTVVRYLTGDSKVFNFIGTRKQTWRAAKWFAFMHVYSIRKSGNIEAGCNGRLGDPK